MPQTAPPTIAALPDAPQTSDGRLVFPGKADAFVAALANFRTQANALGSNVYANAVDAYAQAVAAAQQASASAASATLSQAQVALASAQATAAAASAASALAAPATSATSATSMTPGTGTRSFTTQSGKAFVAGQGLTITSAADPRQWMVGTVSSYSGTALSVNVTAFGQAPTGGAAADWVIAFWGAVPAAGKPGQVLRLRGAVPEWGDVGGEPIQILSSQNLLLRSSDLSAAPWFRTAQFAITADSAASARGEKDADMVVASVNDYVQQNVESVPPGLITYSAEYKAISPGVILHGCYSFSEADLTNTVIAIDLQAGTFSFVNFSRGSVYGKLEALGGGWFRATVAILTTVTASIGAYTQQSTATSWYATGYAVRRGHQPGLYVPTTAAAAAGAGPRRRNLFVYSKEADSAIGGWGLESGAVRVGKAVSPVGDLSATVYGMGSNGLGYVITSFAGAANSQYTLSFWARLLGGSVVTGPGSTARVIYDGAAAVDLFEPLTRAWKRFSVTITTTTSNTVALLPPFHLGVGLQVAVWGVQAELGPVASNLIVTGASAADGQHADLQPRRVHHVDTTHAPVIVAPPSDMQPGDWFDVVDIGGNAAINNVTVLRGPYSAIDGDASDFEIDVSRWGGRFVFDAEKGLVIT